MAISKESELEKQRNGLPDGCPMKAWSIAEFSEFWANPDPVRLATFDPYLRIDLSWLFAETITGPVDPSQCEVLKNHFEWLVRDGSLENVEDFCKALIKCRENASSPSHRLLELLQTKAGLEATRGNEGLCGTAATQAELRKQCHRQSPDLFPPPDDADGWSRLMELAKKHETVARAKAGAPKGTKR